MSERLMTGGGTKLITTDQYGEKHGISRRRVQQLLRDNRIPGAMKVGRDWLIPADALPTRGERGPGGEWMRGRGKGMRNSTN